MTHLPKQFNAAVRMSFLGGVRPAVVAQVLELAYVREIPAGRVFAGASRGHRCGVVVSGLARAYSVREDGSQATQRRVSAGSAVGIHAMVGHRNGVHVQAITDVEFLELNPKLILQLARQDSTLAFAVAEEIDRRLADTEAQVESVAGRVIQKIASALLDLTVEGRPLEVMISQERLAEAVGASRERVGYELRNLARDRLVRAARARIMIVDPLRLQAIARGEIGPSPPDVSAGTETDRTVDWDSSASRVSTNTWC